MTIIAKLKFFLARTIQAAMRVSPSYVGVHRFCHSKFVTWLTSNLGETTVRLRSGPYIVIEPNDWDGRPLFFWGDHDPRITQLCADALKPGELMLDIGANYGEVGLSAIPKVGKSGIVHAFEPNPKIATCLRASAQANSFDNFIVHEIALGASDADGELTIPLGHSGAGSIVGNEGALLNAPSSQQKVSIRDAGEYLKSILDRPISVIKIDVEGMESAILTSMESIISEHKPRLICFESLESPTPFFERDVVRCLDRLGYRFEQLIVNATVLPNPKFYPIVPGGPIQPGRDFVARLKNR
jgi:FkbM family methyltransferase